MIKRFTSWIFVLALASAASAAEGPGTFDITIKEAPPYANAASILRRVSHGLVYRSTVASAAQDRTDLTLFTVNPAEETWSVVVPEAPADGRFGAIAWIPATDDAAIPDDIREAAASEGWLIIVARNSGDDQPVLERRLALALIGTQWLNANYPVDKQRIIVGGEGDGAAIALQLAVGYADIYSSALAVRGGVPLGSEALAVPVKPLPDFLRQRSDIVFISGKPDDDIEEAAASFRDFCVSGTRLLTVPKNGSVADTARTALASIAASESHAVDAACLARYNAARDEDLAELDDIFTNSRWRHARIKLLEAHFKYGGLIEDRVFQYADRYAEEYDDLYAQAAEFVRTGPRMGVLPDFVPPPPKPFPVD